jgi:hypothetical protein
MRRLLPLLLLVLLGACSEKVVKVYITGLTGWAGGWDAYEVDTILVRCEPPDSVDCVELLIDRTVAGVDSYPDPFYGYLFTWDVRQLPEASVHTLQARAFSGGRAYLSSETTKMVGYRSRLIDDATSRSFSVYLPNGELSFTFKPFEHPYLSYPSFGSRCSSIVFIADQKLYEGSVRYHETADLLDSMENGIQSCDASPVSDLVAFEACPGATPHLFIKDGTNPRVQITHDGDVVLIDSSLFTCIENSNPVFSPDGSKLAYYRKSKCLVGGDPHENEYREDAFVMNCDGTNPVNLTAGVADGYFSGFTWTFDGKWVLFRGGRGQDRSVLAANMSGRVISGLGVCAEAMACSPADSTLAYVGIDYERRLYTAKLVWTDDTLYVDGAGILFVGDPYHGRCYIDWAVYTKHEE